MSDEATLLKKLGELPDEDLAMIASMPKDEQQSISLEDFVNPAAAENRRKNRAAAKQVFGDTQVKDADYGAETLRGVYPAFREFTSGAASAIEKRVPALKRFRESMPGSLSSDPEQARDTYNRALNQRQEEWNRERDNVITPATASRFFATVPTTSAVSKVVGGAAGLAGRAGISGLLSKAPPFVGATARTAGTAADVYANTYADVLARTGDEEQAKEAAKIAAITVGGISTVGAGGVQAYRRLRYGDDATQQFLKEVTPILDEAGVKPDVGTVRPGIGRLQRNVAKYNPLSGWLKDFYSKGKGSMLGEGGDIEKLATAGARETGEQGSKSVSGVVSDITERQAGKDIGDEVAGLKIRKSAQDKLAAAKAVTDKKYALRDAQIQAGEKGGGHHVINDEGYKIDVHLPDRIVKDTERRNNMAMAQGKAGNETPALRYDKADDVRTRLVEIAGDSDENFKTINKILETEDLTTLRGLKTARNKLKTIVDSYRGKNGPGQAQAIAAHKAVREAIDNYAEQADEMITTANKEPSRLHAEAQRAYRETVVPLKGKVESRGGFHEVDPNTPGAVLGKVRGDVSAGQPVDPSKVPALLTNPKDTTAGAAVRTGLTDEGRDAVRNRILYKAKDAWLKGDENAFAKAAEDHPDILSASDVATAEDITPALEDVKSPKEVMPQGRKPNAASVSAKTADQKRIYDAANSENAWTSVEKGKASNIDKFGSKDYLSERVPAVKTGRLGMTPEQTSKEITRLSYIAKATRHAGQVVSDTESVNAAGTALAMIGGLADDTVSRTTGKEGRGLLSKAVMVAIGSDRFAKFVTSDAGRRFFASIADKPVTADVARSMVTKFLMQSGIKTGITSGARTGVMARKHRQEAGIEKR